MSVVAACQAAPGGEAQACGSGGGGSANGQQNCFGAYPTGGLGACVDAAGLGRTLGGARGGVGGGVGSSARVDAQGGGRLGGRLSGGFRGGAGTCSAVELRVTSTGAVLSRPHDSPCAMKMPCLISTSPSAACAGLLASTAETAAPRSTTLPPNRASFMATPIPLATYIADPLIGRRPVTVPAPGTGWPPGVRTGCLGRAVPYGCPPRVRVLRPSPRSGRRGSPLRGGVPRRGRWSSGRPV